MSFTEPQAEPAPEAAEPETEAETEAGPVIPPEPPAPETVIAEPPAPMRVRRATFDDIPELTELAVEFFANSDNYWGGSRKLDPPHFASHLCTLISRPEVGFFVGEVDAGDRPELAGAIVVVLLPDVFSGGQIAIKLHWVAASPHRGRGKTLLRAAEEWARDMGAHQLFVSAINDRSEKLLKKLGYSQLEISHCKDL